jgi:hypothetical protein
LEGGSTNFDPSNFWTLKKVQELFVFSTKKIIRFNPWGAGGVPQILISPQILFVVWHKTPCKVSEPYNNPF